MTREQLSDLLRHKAQEAGTQAKLAAEIGVASSYVGGVIRGVYKPGPSILDFLGLEVTYSPKRQNDKRTG